MSIFTLVICCLTTSNLPWFMDLTFRVPKQYCSLLHWTLLPLPVTSTMGIVFTLAPSLHSFWSYFSTLLRSILGTYWPGSTSFSIVSFFLFILFMGFSRQKYWSGLPFPSSVDHVLSELFTVTRPSWVALHSMAHGFIELAKAVIHVMSLVSFLWLWFLSVWPLMVSLRGLWELPDQRDWLQGNLGLVLMGRAMFSKSLIQ